MIQTVWPYLAVMLLAAGLFPSLERRYRWRLFSVLPPIVFTYLFVTALAVGGLWSPTGEVQSAQRILTAHLLPSLLFLLMVTCDLRAILAVGPRVLAVFVCAMASILIAIVLTYLLFRSALPPDGWKMLAALSATWTGGSANLVAVKQMIGLAESSLPPVLLADALVYSMWVLILFSSSAFAPAFNRWSRPNARPYPELAASDSERPADPGGILLWLGIALIVGLGAARIAARAFRFDMYLCGISSLAQIGGVASAPVLAATYSPVLVPIAVLLALLGLILGTGVGLFMGGVLSALAPPMS